MKKRSFLAALVASAAFLVPSVPSATVAAQEERAAGDVTVSFDVAFDGRTYRGVHGVDPFATVPPDIERGDTFVLNGKIFPAGTLTNDMGPDSPGATGKFFCRGVFLYAFEEFSTADVGPIVNSTQTLVLDNGNVLVTDGLEGNVPLAIRAVVGGAGEFSGANGQLKMEVLGPNPSGENNWRFTFTLKKKSLK